MQDVMIDLETLGTGYRPVILSIGAVEFDYRTGELGREFHERINPESSQRDGFKIDAGTVVWWMGQSEEARKALFAGGAFEPVEALSIFADWLGKDKHVWGNGSNFDNRILREAYDLYGMNCPWHYRDDRDMRTFCAMFPRVTLTREGIHHDALDDAIFQTQIMHEAWKAGHG